MKNLSPAESATEPPGAEKPDATPSTAPPSKPTPEVGAAPKTSGEGFGCELRVTRPAVVFISSVSEYPLKRRPGGEGSLGEFRKEVALRIRNCFPFLSVFINEDPSSGGRGSTYDSINAWAAECDLFVGILVGRYGFQDESGFSATHLEFNAAEEQNREKMLVFIEKRLRDPKARRGEGLPAQYEHLLNRLTKTLRKGRIVKLFETWEELSDQIVQQIAGYCAKALCAAAGNAPARAVSKSEGESKWELMTFTDRAAAMRKAFKDLSRHTPEGLKITDEGGRAGQTLRQVSGKGDRYRYLLTMRTGDAEYSVPVLFSVCPDRFSYPEAARYVGYPFRTRTDDWDDAAGPLDIILLFRGITDAQIRRHLGNPDVEITREDWGFFAADPEQAIQAAYLTRCDSPEDIERQVREFLGWLYASRRWRRLYERAMARGAILRAGRAPFVRAGRDKTARTKG